VYLGAFLLATGFPLRFGQFIAEEVEEHTLLCRWIVYSRATTSPMADRPVLPALAVPFPLLDISAECRVLATLILYSLDGGSFTCAGGKSS